ncbi:MAG: 3-phosphoshikimate 1-carboxyvinyltransferase [Pelotomaculaceae bacterium]|nr:3-phosphoshikimate 1-carboxyvinyltransferase [Bacillota bacterium]HHU87259.1 3-phosphoshikimate 1-carboxyvinyltransferase [Peptococcaceae bacterium]
MNLVIKPARSLRGTVSVPGDKSISHRAVMLGALAEGATLIENFLPGEDCLATVACFRKLGVEISWTGKDSLRIQGCGLEGLREPEEVLDAGNSGTTMRLLLGIMAGQPFFSVLNGDASLRCRPMARVTGPLVRMGARIEGRQGGNLAPLAVQGGNLKPVHYNSPVASAQVKSAVLLAGLFAGGVTSVTEPYRSRDHTERMLRHFGAKVDVSGTTVRVAGRPRLLGRKIAVPGDLSSASFLMVAAAALPGSDLTLQRVGINPARSGIIDALTGMGASIELLNPREEGGEPVAEIRVRCTGRLTGIAVGGEMIPRLIDEIPALAVAAALAGGRTEIRDAAELKVKESNRIATVAGMLASFGAVVEELPDGLLVKGGKPLRGCACRSHGDHRIALAASVAGLLAEGETIVHDAECMNVSFPGFDGLLKKILV